VFHLHSTGDGGGVSPDVVGNDTEILVVNVGETEVTAVGVEVTGTTPSTPTDDAVNPAALSAEQL
jgi:hypothetical protein